jgi:alkylated DNA repair protein alkB family protein 7
MTRSLRSASRLLRAYTTAPPAAPYNLSTPTPLIRQLAGSSTDHTYQAIQRDFMFWPNFYTAEESQQILEMALWKLDRADTTRRRRRKSQIEPGAGTGTGLQDLFHGEYGFEEVQSLSRNERQLTG